MIHVRHQDHLVGVVTPAPFIEGMEESQYAIEQRITYSFNILADVPLQQLAEIADNPSPIDALARWLDSRKTSH